MLEAGIAMDHRLLSVKKHGYPVNAVQGNPAVRTLMTLVGPEAQRYRVHSTTEAIPPNLGDILPILTTDGHRSTRLKRYHNWFDFNPHSQRMDMLGVRWWISDTPVEGLPEVGRVGKLIFYERPTALPVFWLAQADGARAPAPIANISWDVNSVKVEMEHPVSGLLVFAQPRYPGWRATADDAKVSLTDDEIFMAVDLTTPARSIEFRYAPFWFLPLLLLAMATLFACFALCLAAAFRRKADSAT